MNDEREALAWVNKIRTAYGSDPLTELPQGRPQGPDDRHPVSPVETALNVRVVLGGLQAVLGNRLIRWPGSSLPPCIPRFIEGYRAGGYPHLHPN